MLHPWEAPGPGWTEQFGLVQDVPAHDRGLELGFFKVPSKSNCPAIL